MDTGNEMATMQANLQALMAKVETLATEVQTLKTDMRVMRTEIVSSVYRLAKSGHLRLNGEEIATADIKERLATIDNRLLGVEQRLDTPPRS